GPFGLGGVIGTGTGTTSCAGALDLLGPGACGGCGPCGSSGGPAGVLSCAGNTGASNKAIVVAIRKRFIGGKPGTLDSVTQNQDSDWNLHLALLVTHRHFRCFARSNVSRDERSVAHSKSRSNH